MDMPSPKTSRGGGGWGVGEGTHRAEKEQGTRHITEKRPHLKKQIKTITHTHIPITIITTIPSVL